MKVMVVAPYFYPRIGGMENYAFNISRLLVKNYAADVSVVCSDWERGSYREEMTDGIKVYRLPYLFKVSTTPVNPFWYRKIAWLVAKEKPAIINGHIPVPYIGDIAARVAVKYGIPFVLTYHNDVVGQSMPLAYLSRFYYRWLGFQTLKVSRRIIVTSRYYADSSLYLRRWSAKLAVVHSGVDDRRFDIQAQPSKENKSILFVGQLNRGSRHKGLRYLIEAMRLVEQDVRDAKLVVVGEGDYLNRYRDMAKADGVRGKVEFVGLVDDGALPRYYNESDVLVLPSCNRSEGLGLVLIEAQACGKPVIGTTVGGIPYAIKDNETGLLVPPKDSEALARAIIRLLKDNDLARRLGENGYRRVRAEFTWEKSAEKTYQVYQSALKGRR